MALPAVAAGAAKGLSTLGQGLAKAGKGVGQLPGGKGTGPSPGAVPEEGEEETPAEAATRKFAAIFSPQGLVMFTVAGILDLVGAFLLILDIFFGIGEILSYIPDVIGILFFGLWLYFRSSGERSLKETTGELKEKVAERRQERKQMVKTARKGLSRVARFGLSALGELLPFIGAIPFWTIFVYQELTSKKE